MVSTFINCLSLFRGPAPLSNKAVASTLDVFLSLVISVLHSYMLNCSHAFGLVKLLFSMSTRQVLDNPATATQRTPSPLEVCTVFFLPSCLAYAGTCDNSVGFRTSGSDPSRKIILSSIIFMYAQSLFSRDK